MIVTNVIIDDFMHAVECAINNLGANRADFFNEVGIIVVNAVDANEKTLEFLTRESVEYDAVVAQAKDLYEQGNFIVPVKSLTDKQCIEQLEAENADVWYESMLKDQQIQAQAQEIADLWYEVMKTQTIGGNA